jgi:hypothetical protein
MGMRIKTSALRKLLNIILSCRCPMKKDVEEKVISFYLSQKNKKSVDYRRIIQIADQTKKETVFHRLKKFCQYSKNDLNKEIIITEEDVFRHFCSTFHWRVIEKKHSL